MPGKLKRTSKTDEHLRKVSRDLYYEVWMLESLANILASGQLAQGTPLANAALEAFSIHVRAVLDFLYNDSPRADDVVAQHFLPSATRWANLRPPMASTLILAKSRIGKEVAHLTYARLDLTPETKPWPFVEIAADISIVFGLFLDSATKDLLDEIWSN